MAADSKNPGMRALWRISLWGMAAAVALALAAFAARSEMGAQRLAAAIANFKSFPAAGPSEAEREARRLAEAERETLQRAEAEREARRLAEAEREARQRAEAERERERKQLAETVRVLTEDRDRLATRLSALERTLEDVTGSIARQATTRQPEVTAPPPTPPAPAGSDLPSASVATKTEIGIDIGSGTTLDELRVLWSAAKTNYSALFAGLRPVAAVGETKPEGVELRLVVGPLANAAEAARLCAALSASGFRCQPSVFEGQRLALQ
jgi:hypothetical protein